MSTQQPQIPEFTVDLPGEGSVDLTDLHYFDCDRFNTYDYGSRMGACDCQDTVAALLTAFREQVAAEQAAEARRLEAVVRGAADALDQAGAPGSAAYLRSHLGTHPSLATLDAQEH